MKEIWVIAKSNPVPREDSPRRLIAAEPTKIALTTYYQRRIGDDELVEVADPTLAPPAPPKTTTTPAPAPTTGGK